MTKDRMSGDNFKKWKVVVKAVDLEHCSKLHRVWHEVPSDTGLKDSR